MQRRNDYLILLSSFAWIMINMILRVAQTTSAMLPINPMIDNTAVLEYSSTRVVKEE